MTFEKSSFIAIWRERAVGLLLLEMVAAVVDGPGAIGCVSLYDRLSLSLN